ncbi:MAG: GWxTD domain-containing protein [Balneolaceae bacterium]|nr:MAG: GWxTD domain-containing protein [Balneolaceae bacterium]
MGLKTNILLTVILLFLSASAGRAQQNNTYERGLEEVRNGNVTRALELWYGAYFDGDVIVVDSRIGFEFIRVVTEMELRSWYETATSMYYKALKNGSGNESRAAIRQEIERLRPLTGDGVHRQWLEWWGERRASVGIDMAGFWIQLDPTPAEILNERLIEHWERIADARRQFSKNRSTIFGTDDRSLIYIRYGQPDRRNSGILTLQTLNIMPWLQRQLLPAGAERMRGEDSDTETAQQDPQTAEVLQRLERAMYDFHRYPEYEIWFYENLIPGNPEPVIFLFGTDVRTDQFRLQTSLDDFIPERAFHPDRDRPQEALEFVRAGITPAIMLQLLYYEQLSAVDPFFRERLNELRERILEQRQDVFAGMDLDFKSESRQLVNSRTIQAPRQRSVYEGLLPKIPMQVHQYRFLDDEGKPYVLTYVESNSTEAFLIDFHRNNGRVNGSGQLIQGTDLLSEFPLYEVRHSVQVYDAFWNLAYSGDEFPQLVLEHNPDEHPSSALFRLPNRNRSFQSASVQLMNFDPGSESVQQTPFPSSVRGWNRLQFRQPQPLVSHSDTLEVADLVLGYPDSRNPTQPFSFRVANDQMIPLGETLLLHFQVYHLTPMENGFTQFELTYRIYPVDDAGNVNREQTEFILTLNFINEEVIVVEDLEIQTADLGVGLYELVVLFTDTESGQSRERLIRFEVTDDSLRRTASR